MKRSIHALVLLAGMAGISSTASAAPVDLTTVCDINIYLSGASAQDNSLNSQVTGLMLSGAGNIPGTNIPDGTIFPGLDDSSWRIIVGRIDNAAITAGTGGVSTTNPVACVHKRSEGGSAWGVQPVSQGNGGGVSGRTLGTPVAMMTGLDCDDGTAGGTLGCDQTDVGETVLIVPDGGLSDVEPVQFNGLNTPSTPQVDPSDNLGGGISDPVLAGMSPTDINNLQVFQQSMFAFGIGISNNFYKALQVCQGLIPTFATADDFNSVATMPTLSKAEVVGMQSGNLVSMRNIPCTNFDTDFAKPAALNLYDVAAAAGVAPTFTGPELCQRVDGSGTQAQFRIKVLANGCLASGALDFADGGGFSPFTVVQNSGSGDMDACLNGTAGVAQSERYKIGFQSTNRASNIAAGSVAWRFVKVDNQVPSLANVANGAWFDAVQSTLQLRAPASREYFHAVEDTGNAQDVENILQTLIANFAVPSAVAAANASETYTAGQVGEWFGGSLVVHGAGCDVNSGATGFGATTNPCAFVTHEVGGQLNNCRTPVYTGPAILDYDGAL